MTTKPDYKNKSAADSRASAKVKEARKSKKELRQIKLQRRVKKPNHELSVRAKQIWEKLRCKKITLAEKKQLADELYGLVQGKAKNLLFAHDTVRVMQCLMALKSTEIRNKLFEELKEHILELSKTKYSKFFVVKMLKYGSKEQKAHIMNSLYGNSTELMKHGVGCDVLQCVYNEYANAAQRTRICAQFFGNPLQFQKIEEATCVADFLTANEDKKTLMIKNLAENIVALTTKSCVRHSLFHQLCQVYFDNCDDVNAKKEVASCVKDRLVEMVHTRDGVCTAMQCVLLGSAKDRKTIVKGMKGVVTKLCRDEHGHFLLPVIFDCVDDTVLVSSVILKEIKQNLASVLGSKFGIRVILHLLKPLDSRHFDEKFSNLLTSAGDTSKTASKKAASLKREELLNQISAELLSFAAENAKQMIFEVPAYPLLFSTIVENCPGDKSEIFKSLCEIMRQEFIPGDPDNLHIVEHPRGHYIVVRMLKNDAKLRGLGQTTLSQVMAEELEIAVFDSWLSCNKGAFVLIHMMENGGEKVETLVRDCVKRNIKKLKKYSFKGAGLLLQKLDQSCTDAD